MEALDGWDEKPPSSESEFDERIVGGRNASLGEFGWQVREN